MTTLQHANVHPVGVSGCPDGGDDLDIVIAKLYANQRFKEKLHLSSVNSINWGRIMMQTVHYFYGYFRVAEKVGDPVNFAVPSGGFGNLCAGALARMMGLPAKTLVVANNENACLHRIFSKGSFTKAPIIETASSAIDILIPYNFWRFLYFAIGKDATKIKAWSEGLMAGGQVAFDEETHAQLSKGFLSNSATDAQTLSLIKEIYNEEQYMLDPHGAVALQAADELRGQLGDEPLLCLATAHPAKFPEVIKEALGVKVLPEAAKHESIEEARKLCEKVHLCHYEHLEAALLHAMETNWDLTKGK